MFEEKSTTIFLESCGPLIWGDIFLITFFGLYFSHHLHITNYNYMLYFCAVCRYHVLLSYTPDRLALLRCVCSKCKRCCAWILYTIPQFKFELIKPFYSGELIILSLAGIWTRDLNGGKPPCQPKAITSVQKNHQKIIVIGQIIGPRNIDSFSSIESIIKFIIQICEMNW